MGLAAICNAELLSQNMVTGLECLIFKSRNRKVSHCASQAAIARALYSASKEDLETVFCFLLFQETRALPIKKHQPVIDLLVSTHLAQSESEYPCMVVVLFAGKKILCPGVLHSSHVGRIPTKST
ncbi:unnamed protein product [Lupinus luteus]|uniref:Uncharacterized protein n=1 Tax=Lupinus luteus TaxID=3873 RepID=A0AAV1YLX6_LUPLU